MNQQTKTRKEKKMKIKGEQSSRNNSYDFIGACSKLILSSLFKKKNKNSIHSVF